jgi:hypothetical protein
VKKTISQIAEESSKAPEASYQMHPLYLIFSAILILFTFSIPTQAAGLPDDTVQAWDQYLQWANQKVQKELAPPDKFLVEDSLAQKERDEVKRKLQAGQIITGKVSGVIPARMSFSVPNAEIHHWWGAILLPNIQLSDLLAFLKDYDHHAGRFADVEQSRLISKQDDYYRFYFRLKHTQSIITAYYDTEQECQYKTWDSKHVSSRSNAYKIAELENPGTSTEREKTPGDDRGFMWRLVSWWRFEQVENGVIVELESTSLSRDIPLFVKLLPGVSNYIRSMPRKTIESILTSIREYTGSMKNKPAAQ